MRYKTFPILRVPTLDSGELDFASTNLLENTLRFPLSVRRTAWKGLIFLAVLYNLVAIPTRLMFPAATCNYSLAIDFTLDVVLLVDIVLHGRYFGYVTARRKRRVQISLAENYLQNYRG